MNNNNGDAYDDNVAGCLPSDIAEQVAQDILNKNPQDSSDMLQRLLSALSQLHAHAHAHAHAQQPQPVAAAVADNDLHLLFPPAQIWALWKKEVSVLVGRNMSSKGDPAYEWTQGFVLIQSLLQFMAPLDLHTTALESMVFSDQDECRSVLYTTTCLLLCCRALQSCSPDISVLKKPKRWLSTCFETIRLFQRYCYDDSSSLILRHVHVPLWVEYIVPSCVQVQHAVVVVELSSNSDSANDWSWVQAALVASVVSTTARLAQGLYQEQEQEQQQSYSKNLADNDAHASTAFAFSAVASMLSSILDTVADGRLETICIHPWRPLSLPESIQIQSLHQLSLEAALVVWTMEQDEDDEDDEEYDNLDTKDTNRLLFRRMREQAANVETVWDHVGVAILVAVGLQAVDNSMRPFVWSPVYIWRMGFPHVAILLNSNDNDNGDDDGDDAVCIQALGFQLLDTLLHIVPNQSLTAPTHYASESSRAPDSPIGTLQLVSNRIVASASAAANRKVSQSLPDATRAFQLMKELVGKYKACDQVAIVRQLVHDCPHPGLKPKFLDILRVFVSWGDETEGLSDVWSYLDTLVQNLQESIDTTNPSSGPVLRDATTLIDGVEVYVSALSLMHLWILVKKTALGIHNLSSRLSSIHVAVKTTLSRWADDDCAAMPPPEQHFRLHLLESSLQNTIDVLPDTSR